MKKVNELKKDDYIVFEYENDLMYSDITEIKKDNVLCHFHLGFKTGSKWIKKNEIIAIKNNKGKGKIKHWFGNFDILIPNHKLLNK